MKKKSLRRHQQQMARVRHVLYLWSASHTWYWQGSPYRVMPDPEYTWLRWRHKPWQQVSRCTMHGEPKAWQKAFNLRPSRVRQNQLLRHIERGMDPDAIRRWPDYRKPHIYYW